MRENKVSMKLVRAMKGVEPMGLTQGPGGEAAGGSDSEDSDQKSVCSTTSKTSNLSTLSTISSSPTARCRSSTSSASSGNKSIHLGFDDCSIDIEMQNSSDPSKMSLCHDFTQLCGEASGQADSEKQTGLLECLKMYGFQKPNKLQQHAIPAILHHMGRQLGGKQSSTSKGKGCIVIQGPARTGKTSSVVLAMLAAIDLSLQQPQVILLSGAAGKKDFDKYLNIFTLMDSVTFQSFSDEDQEDICDRSPQVRAARTAHILIGPPRRMLQLLSEATSLCLDSVKALVIDDAEELLYSATATEGGTASSAAAAVPHTADTEEKTQTLSTPPLTSPLLDDIVQICNVLECRQYSQNMSDTYRIRSGKVQGTKIRYLILMRNLIDPSSRKVLRLLKSSIMKKKNLLSMESCPLPTKMIKAMKHYYAQAPRSEWVRIFAGLVQTLMFPRALIFCDDEGIHKFYQEMQEMGIAVSANMLDKSPGGQEEARRKAVQDFSTNRSQFLLTRSEPAVCQLVLPKVSCLFHFGIPPQLSSIYGVRLNTLDPQLSKDAASIFFVDGTSGGASGATPPVVSAVGKLFEIRFLDMPFEFLPASAVAEGKQGGRRRR